jgi:hypothetical protein
MGQLWPLELPKLMFPHAGFQDFLPGIQPILPANGPLDLIAIVTRLTLRRDTVSTFITFMRKCKSMCNDAGKTRDPNLAWSHSEAYGSAWESRNLGSIDTYRSCTKGLQKTAYLHLGDCNVKYTKAMKC